MRLIDADALLEKHKPIMGGIRVDAWDVYNAPTIEAEPVKRGRWVDAYGDTVGMVNGVPWSDCWCEECGERLVGSGEYPAKGYYCPNCGAKMDAEDEA